MAKQRRQYTQEYKREAVRFLEETGRPVREVAAELQLAEPLLGKWRKQFGSGVSPGPLSPSDAEELRRLRRENEVLRQERDFLKKAAAYFANGPRDGTP